ncbi:phosphonate ABC transporter, permease protein PhnE [Candidatus Poribacteria bacterium]|nr:phosphonate ABC transporter, permease protein PhnE [Candidatus Poribacteria bacterium]
MKSKIVNKASKWFWLIIIFVILAWSWEKSEMGFVSLFKGTKDVFIYLKDYFPPDFSRTGIYLKEISVSLSIAIWGTLLALITSLPLGLMASKNVVGNPVIHQVLRRILDFLRAVDQFIFALIFVVAVGLGPFAGVLALTIHNIGVLGKLISEIVESIDKGQVEAITSVGANRVQVISFGIIPQIMPLWVSNALYRFEVNVRASIIIGFTGAGGIGFLLWEAIRSFKSKEVCAMLLIMVVMVSLIDLICSKIRKYVT